MVLPRRRADQRDSSANRLARSISRRCSDAELHYQSTPDDHFTASPHCRVRGSGRGYFGRAGGRPTIGAGIISPAGVQVKASKYKSTPDDHFTASPHCCVKALGQRVRWSCSWPSNYPCWDCISRRCSNRRKFQSTPDDHFTASPHCRVRSSGIGRVGRAGGRPTIGAGIVSPAGVQIACR